MKLKIQFEAVDKAFAGARIRSGVTSAGYSQVIPSHPIENHVLKRNKQSTETTCEASFPACSMLYSPARTAIVPAWAAAVQSMSGRRPTRSMMVMAIRLVRK